MKDKDSKLLEEKYENLHENKGQGIFVVLHEIDYEGATLIGVCQTLEAAKTLKNESIDPDLSGPYDETNIYQVPFNVDISLHPEQYKVDEDNSNEDEYIPPGHEAAQDPLDIGDPR